MTMKSLLLVPFKSAKALDSFYSQKIAHRNQRELRSLVKIAVIDDEPFRPFENLSNNNYSITLLGDIRSIDLVKPFDLIICDIIGVGTALDKDLQGAALITEIAKTFPEKIVIANTGATLSQLATREAKLMADTLIKKDTTIQEWMDTLDKYVNDCLNPVKVWSRIRYSLTARGVDTKDIILLEDAFSRSFLQKSPSSKLVLDVINNNNFGSDARSIITGLISSAIYSAFGGS